MKNFITSLLVQMPEGTVLPDERMIPMTTAAGEVTAIILEDDPETVLFRAAVGSLAGVSDSDGFLRLSPTGSSKGRRRRRSTRRSRPIRRSAPR